jgi:hypothetical protein
MVRNLFFESYESFLVVVMARRQHGCTHGGEQEERKTSDSDEAPWQQC